MQTHDKLAVSTRNALYMMLDAGIPETRLKPCLERCKRACEGYYYNDSVLRVIKEESHHV